MAKTDNIPPAWQKTVLAAIATCIEQRTGMPPDEILKKIYTELVNLMAPYAQHYTLPVEGSEKPIEMDLPIETLAYTALGLRRVVKYAMKYADENPPTHRKGYGDSFETTIYPGPLIFKLGGGTKGSWPEGPGNGYPDPEEPPPDDDGGGYIEWVPPEETSRAKAMLNDVAAEVGFGAGDDPLDFIRQVAKRLGGNWGLNGKRGNPNDPSKDVLSWRIEGYAPQNFDVIQDAGGKNKITWQPLPYYAIDRNAVWIEP